MIERLFAINSFDMAMCLMALATIALFGILAIVIARGWNKVAGGDINSQALYWDVKTNKPVRGTKVLVIWSKARGEDKSKILRRFREMK